MSDLATKNIPHPTEDAPKSNGLDTSKVSEAVETAKQTAKEQSAAMAAAANGLARKGAAQVETAQSKGIGRQIRE